MIVVPLVIIGVGLKLAIEGQPAVQDLIMGLLGMVMYLRASGAW